MVVAERVEDRRNTVAQLIGRQWPGIRPGSFRLRSAEYTVLLVNGQDFTKHRTTESRIGYGEEIKPINTVFDNEQNIDACFTISNLGIRAEKLAFLWVISR